MLNKGMHKPTPLFCMDIVVVQFIFLFFFYISINNNTNILWLGWFCFHQPFYFTFFYVFCTFLLKSKHALWKGVQPKQQRPIQKYRKHMTLKCDIFFSSFSSSSFDQFSLCATEENTMQQTIENCIRFCFAMKTIFWYE